MRAEISAPPDTSTTVPVMYGASADSSHSTARATALTRMPSPATSRARPRVKLSMAPLDAA